MDMFDSNYLKMRSHLEFAGFARQLFKEVPGLCIILNGNFIPIGEIIQDDHEYLGLNVTIPEEHPI